MVSLEALINEQGDAQKINKLEDQVKLYTQSKSKTKRLYRRTAVIDGANFMHRSGGKLAFCGPDASRSNAAMLAFALRKLLSRGHAVVIVLKSFYADEDNCLNSCFLEQLERAGFLIFVEDAIDDDDYALALARRLDGFVISRDKFKQAQYDEYNDIKNRVVSFSIKRAELAHIRQKMEKAKSYYDARNFFEEQVNVLFDVNIECCGYIYAESPIEELEEKCQPLSYFQRGFTELNVVLDYYRLLYCLSLNLPQPPILSVNINLDTHVMETKFEDFLFRYREQMPPEEAANWEKNWPTLLPTPKLDTKDRSRAHSDDSDDEYALSNYIEGYRYIADCNPEKPPTPQHRPHRMPTQHAQPLQNVGEEDERPFAIAHSTALAYVTLCSFGNVPAIYIRQIGFEAMDPSNSTESTSSDSSWFLPLIPLALPLLYAIYLVVFIMRRPLPPPLCGEQRYWIRFLEVGLRLINTSAMWIEFCTNIRLRLLYNRAMFALQFHMLHPRLPKWVSVRNERFAGCRCRVYVPEPERRTSRSLVVFIHGGGWCLLNPRLYDTMAVSIVRRTGATLLSIDYSLAPEQRFPTPINECEKVIVEIYERGYKELDVDREKIVLIGDSAGGHSSAVICQRFANSGRNFIKALVLIYPVTTCLDALTPSQWLGKEVYRGVAFLDRAAYSRFWFLYLGIRPSRKRANHLLTNRHLTADVRADPEIERILSASRQLSDQFVAKEEYRKWRIDEEDTELSADFAPFLRDVEVNPILQQRPMPQHPPTLLISAGVDIVRDEGIIYAKRLEELGVAVRWNHYPAAFHTIFNACGVHLAGRILDDMADHLRTLAAL